eukprot:scaffold1634_cov137-Amphora_coffeaeformis.AAC.1
MILCRSRRTKVLFLYCSVLWIVLMLGTRVSAAVLQNDSGGGRLSAPLSKHEGVHEGRRRRRRRRMLREQSTELPDDTKKTTPKKKESSPKEEEPSLPPEQIHESKDDEDDEDENEETKDDKDKGDKKEKKDDVADGATTSSETMIPSKGEKDRNANTHKNHGPSPSVSSSSSFIPTLAVLETGDQPTPTTMNVEDSSTLSDDLFANNDTAVPHSESSSATLSFFMSGMGLVVVLSLFWAQRRIKRNRTIAKTAGKKNTGGGGRVLQKQTTSNITDYDMDDDGGAFAGAYMLRSHEQMDEFLRATGASWALRSAAVRARPVMNITHDENQNSSAGNNDLVVIKFKGVPRLTYVLDSKKYDDAEASSLSTE